MMFTGYSEVMCLFCKSAIDDRDKKIEVLELQSGEQRTNEIPTEQRSRGERGSGYNTGEESREVFKAENCLGIRVIRECVRTEQRQ
jgi:hypothetical protein